LKWPEVVFESLYGAPSRNGIYKPKEFHGSGCRMVNMGELFHFDFLGVQEMERVELTEAELGSSRLEDGDLLFGRRSLVEAGAGKCSIVVELAEPLTFESSIIRVRLNREKVNPRFYFYYFASPYGGGKVRSIVSGTNVKGIRGSDLKTLKVVKPPVPTQDRITDILCGYDELIENNRRRMELLEEAARQLYREWFVRLRFPGREHTRINNGVPEEWERTAFENALVLQRGFDLPIQVREDGEVPVYGSTGINGFHNKAKVQGPGLVTGRSGTLGQVHYVPRDFWPLNTALWVKEFKRVTPLFALFLLREMDLKQYNGGVSVPSLDRKAVHRVDILVPPKKLIAVFDEFASPLFAQIENLGVQNDKLRAARDLLLPRLMSGEIAV
jgi:type I restriction enzyme S subunit